MAPSTRRRAAAAGVAGAAALLVGGPAFGHASFPGSTNPTGTAASPYPAGSVQTIKIAVPFEQEGVMHNGAPNTTVDTKITAPTGWTTAGCGEARRADLSAVVPGWACSVSAVAGRQVLSWNGPQVAAGAAAELSAQYFTFTIKVPSPGATTAYGGTGSTADGFRVVQKYADGATSTWKTPNDTTLGENALGLVRTVAGTGAAGTPTPTPLPSASQTPTPTPRVATPTPVAATPTPTPAATLEPLPHTGGRVSGDWLLASAGVLSGGLVLLATSVDVSRRRQGR